MIEKVERIMDISGLAVKMLIFVVLMVIGYACAKTGYMDKGFTKTANWLVINVFMSATIINSVLTVEVNMGWAELGECLLVLSVELLLCYLLAAAVSRLLPLKRGHAPLFELLLASSNNIFIALPVAEELFGPMAVFYCSLSCIPFNIMLYTYGVWRLKSGEGGGIRVKDILTVPLVVTLISTAIFIFKIPIPAAVRELLSCMSGATMPLSMIVIGASLGSVSLLDAFKIKNWDLYLMSFLRLIVSPLLVLAVCRLLTDDPVLLFTSVVIGASPSAVIISVLTMQYGKDGIYSSEGVLHSTVLSMLTIPLMMYFLV